MKRSQYNEPLVAAILEAAAELGSDGKGRDGLVGYLEMLARKYPALYATQLLGKTVDYEPPKAAEPKRVFRNRQEIEAEMRARGLPIPVAVEVLVDDKGPSPKRRATGQRARRMSCSGTKPANPKRAS